MKIKKRLMTFAALILLVGGMVCWRAVCAPKRVVNVYDWYGMLPTELLKEFEEKTGIRVRYDVYCDNETAEVKLLAGRSGYDIVFPSAVPYAAWQIQAGLYAPLDFAKLPIHEIDPVLWARLDAVDPGHRFLIPYYLGSIGIVYDPTTIQAILGDLFQVHKNSWAMLFEPSIAARLAPYGISLLEESVDVFPIVEIYRTQTLSQSIQVDQLPVLTKHLRAIRPFVRKMGGSRIIHDLIMGDVVVAQSWSGEGLRAVHEAREIGKNLVYVLPREGSLLWFDCIAIPRDAPHPEEAYTFIRFLMDPKIAARITNHAYSMTTIKRSTQWVRASIRDNPNVWIGTQQLQTLHLNHVPKTKRDFEVSEKQNRLWAEIRLDRKGGGA